MGPCCSVGVVVPLLEGDRLFANSKAELCCFLLVSLSTSSYVFEGSALRGRSTLTVFRLSDLRRVYRVPEGEVLIPEGEGEGEVEVGGGRVESVRLRVLITDDDASLSKPRATKGV